MKSYIVIDSIIFMIANLILGVYVFKNKKLELKEKIAYTIFFIILNSSYNIMIKSVHQHNMSIPRTFIYRNKIIGSFTLLDIICVLFIVVNSKYLINIIFRNKLILVHLIRAVGLYLIGTISFMMMQGYWMDEGSKFIITSKGWVYTLATLILTFRYMSKDVNLIYPFAIILINGMLSTFFIPIEDIWMRYNHRSIIIDQEDASTISNCIIVLLSLKCFYKKDERISKRLVNFALLAFFLFQNIYCIYKSNIIILPIIFGLYILITNGKNKILTMAASLGIPTMILFLWDKIYALFTSVAIETRFAQLTDYMNYIKNEGIYPYILGSGIGTPYYSPTDTGDQGEIKEIILTNNSYYAEWRNEIQTPVISIMKDSGIIGLLYFFVTTFYIIIITYNMIKNVINTRAESGYLHIETIGLGLIVMVQSLLGNFWYGGVLPVCFFYTFCLAKFVINCKNIKHIWGKQNENINNK